MPAEPRYIVFPVVPSVPIITTLQNNDSAVLLLGLSSYTNGLQWPKHMAVRLRCGAGMTAASWACNSEVVCASGRFL